jgi:hypothetical protein
MKIMIASDIHGSKFYAGEMLSQFHKEKADKLVSEGAKISVRGLGKILLRTVGSQTKKGRISITIDRYI